MYKSIHVENFSFDEYKSIPSYIIDNYENKNKDIIIDLEEYLLNSDEIFDVEKINKHLFNDIKPDIFLSHSHADATDIIKLAAKIEHDTKLNVFVDSCVWGNAYNLLRKIDDKYCYQESNNTYAYNKRNHTTSNVFMILNAALHKVINSSEVLLFLETSNSVSIQDVLTKDKYLSSPWIFSELQFAGLVKRIKPSRFLNLSLESHNQPGLAEDKAYVIKDAKFAYTPPPTDFKIDNNQFRNWVESLGSLTESYPLDDLYLYETQP